VVSDGSEQGVDLLLPTSPSKTSLCNSNLKNKVVKYPSGADVLTVLLLVLHPNTWFGIKDEGVKAEFQNLVSTDNLPDLLKREVR
jgi:glutathione gamma-glutamylcysteinyltransferase